MPLVACVPNVSEARRTDVVDGIAESIAAVRGVKLLDITSDVDHNRTVFTFTGQPGPVKNGAIALIQSAMEHIDIRHHQGKYPRMGIVDVIPFVPLRDTPMERAIRLANSAAAEIARLYNIPVYMYDYAAKKEERRSLRYIRKGEFEGFLDKISKPEWIPDYGPQQVHPTAGVTTVGARYPLVAMNLRFKGAERGQAEEIAAHLMGELQGDGRLKLQLIHPRDYDGWKIAATLMDYKTITVCDLVLAARDAAEQRNVNFDGTELVGLVTGDALFDCLERHLGLHNFNPLQILDFHIFNK